MRLYGREQVERFLRWHLHQWMVEVTESRRHSRSWLRRHKLLKPYKNSRRREKVKNRRATCDLFRS